MRRRANAASGRGVSGALALAWLATVALVVARRAARAVGARRRRHAAAGGDREAGLRKILRDLDSACAVNDPAAARDALLAFGETRFTADSPRSLGALAALLPDAVGTRGAGARGAHLRRAPRARGAATGSRAVLGELERRRNGAGAGRPASRCCRCIAEKPIAFVT